MIRHTLILLVKSVITFSVTVVVMALGMVTVALALPFRTEHDGAIPFSQYPGNGEWRLVTLPRWAKWWDNIYDGMWGDKRGWWDNNCRETYGKTCKAFKSMYVWAAIRNSANYFKRNVVGVDVSECDIIKLAGQEVVEADKGFPGWQFLVALRRDGKLFHRFFLEIPWSFKPDRLLLIDIGWKIKMSHNGTSPEARPQDRFKGSVFTISPWKAL